MDIKITIDEIDHEDAYHETGVGEWGVRLNANEIIAWQCPLLGDGGGTSENQNALAWMFARYCDAVPERHAGPDEVLFVQGGSYYLCTITLDKE